MTDRTELRLTLRWQLARLLDRWAWALLRGDARATCRREGHFILDGECQRCEVQS